MTTVQQDLLSLLSQVLFNKDTNVQLTPELLAEAKAQAVSVLVSPSEYQTLAQNLRVINAHAEMSSVLEGISFVTFKGYASAYYYPQPERRNMGDVDLIVHPADYDAALERLIAAGWRKIQMEHERHQGLIKNHVEVELHSEIKGIPNGLDGIITDSTTAEAKVRGYLSDLIETAVTVETQQGPIVIPDEFHHGLIMLLHVAGHMLNSGGVGLRHLCDWAVYVDRVDLQKFKPQLEDMGLWTFTCQLTAVSSRYLGLPKKPWAGTWPDSFLEALIEDILSAGNFGRKEVGRTYALRYEKTSFAEMTRKRFPKANNPALLPFYMIGYAFRYVFRVLTGKRKLIKPSTVAAAKGRNELYKQFRLFEYEK